MEVVALLVDPADHFVHPDHPHCFRHHHHHLPVHLIGIVVHLGVVVVVHLGVVVVHLGVVVVVLLGEVVEVLVA